MCGVLNSKQLTWIFTPSNHNSYIRVILKCFISLYILQRKANFTDVLYIYVRFIYTPKQDKLYRCTTYLCTFAQKLFIYVRQSKAGYIDVLYLCMCVLQKSKRDFHKLEKALQPEELAQTLSCLTTEQRHMQLDKQFQELVTVYRHVIDRLAAAS